MNAIQNHLPFPAEKITKTIVLVGMPGAGKTSVGKRLAARLGLPFVDSDMEIEAAAGMKVADIFTNLGEPAFREGERKVIARILSGPPVVLSTGGGAFMNEITRALIAEKAVSVCLQVDFPILLERILRNANRPLLKKPDPEAALRGLLEVRGPVYATAQLVVQSDERPPEETVDRVLTALLPVINAP